jgi:hypothetical protein
MLQSGRLAVTILTLAACAGQAPAQRVPVPEPLMTAALAGAPVIVIPITMVVAEPGASLGTLAPDRPALLHWADSLVGQIIQERAPEVRWVLPAELRRVARRSVGLVADPDQMGQAILRQSTLKTVPDPLRGYLRNLMAVAGGGRHAFIPAAIILSPGADGRVRVRVSAVLADGRSGAILWRTEVEAEGTDPSAALTAALAIIFPIL